MTHIRFSSSLTPLGIALLCVWLVCFGIAATPMAIAAEPVPHAQEGLLVGDPQPDFAIVPPAASETVYGEYPLSLATVGQQSSGAVTWSVPTGNPVATIDSDTGEVSAFAAGSVEVTAVAPSDGVFDEATATYVLTITPRPVVVQPVDVTIQFGDPVEGFDFTISPGLVGVDTLTGSLKLEGAMTLGENSIVEDEPFANPNYRVTFLPGVLTVTPSDAQQQVIDAIAALPQVIATYEQVDTVIAATQLVVDLLSPEEIETLPKPVVKRLIHAQDESGAINHKDPSSGVIASGEQLPWYVRLVVSEGSAADAAAFIAGLEPGRALLTLHGIHLVDLAEGTAWQPDPGSVVTIEMTDVPLADAGKIQVQHLNAAGEMETLPVTVSGTTIRFEAPSFSLFGVTGLKSVREVNDLANTGVDSASSALWGAAGKSMLLAGAAVLMIAMWRRGILDNR